MELIIIAMFAVGLAFAVITGVDEFRSRHEPLHARIISLVLTLVTAIGLFGGAASIMFIHSQLGVVMGFVGFALGIVAMFAGLIRAGLVPALMGKSLRIDNPGG